MKKVGDLMAELGFKPEGSDSVKRAFIENLVRTANENSRPRSVAPEKPKAENQLSFDFSDDPGVPFPFERKRPAG